MHRAAAYGEAVLRWSYKQAGVLMGCIKPQVWRCSLQVELVFLIHT